MRPRRRKQKDKPSSPAQSGTRNNGASGAPRDGEYYFTSLTSTTAQGNSANDMWNIYLDAFKDEDRRIAEEWKEGSSGILTFVSPDLLTSLFILMTCSKTGLFSVIVAAFIIEFYKKLSPGSAVQTVVLLGQISRQLANFPNAYSNTADEPSSDASMIWVIGMWLISLWWFSTRNAASRRSASLPSCTTGRASARVLPVARCRPKTLLFCCSAALSLVPQG
jgi:hypothetical protein